MERVKKVKGKYSQEYRQEAVRMIQQGRKVMEVSRALGVSDVTLYKWMKEQSEVPRVDSDTSKEHLIKRIKELEEEKEILKKALSIFSRPTL